MHIPVLLKESIRFLNPKQGEFIIDGTAGSGGHGAAIFEKIKPDGKLLCVDWDAGAIEELKEKFKISDSELNLIFVNANYADLPEILETRNLGKADGLILDLGFSSIQLEKSGRGFSYLKDEPLDMRYNAAAGATAAEAVNSLSEKELADVIFRYGEERYSRRIAKKIIEERRKKRILTTFHLAEIIKNAVPKKYEGGRKNPAMRTFQALRIYVNKELENLEAILKNLVQILKPKGRAVIISFHSLEDRLVKNVFRQMSKNGQAEILTKKPIRPVEDEIRNNPRSRSAKLRAIKIIE